MDREAIYDALLNLLATANNFKYKSRQYLLWEECGKEQFPALFILEGNEDYETVRGMDSKVVLNCEAYVYINNGNSNKVNHFTELNKTLDKIHTLFKPENLFSQNQDLGGLVGSVTINGTIRKFGLDLNQNGAAAIIPIQIVVNH